MKDILADLVEVLGLERLDTNLFRGQSRDIGSPQVFGGQVLGQALSAANRTIEDWPVHSLHAYFLRKGDAQAPIIYEVDRQRDGRSFASRRVVAIQNGHPILNMAASFQIREDGPDHQAEMPKVPAPEALEDLAAIRRRLTSHIPEERLPRLLRGERPFEFRPVEPPESIVPKPSEPRQNIWFRAVDRLPDDDRLHRNLLAYASDFSLVLTALRPHGLSVFQRHVQVVSLDHAMWFHRPFRVDEWLLYATDSPSASAARGLARGLIFKQDGTLVASVVQEGLTRVWPEKKDGEMDGEKDPS